MPRLIARRCLCEQTALDTLVMMVEDDALNFGVRFQRVDGGADGVYGSSHSIGVVDWGAATRWVSSTSMAPGGSGRAEPCIHTSEGRMKGSWLASWRCEHAGPCTLPARSEDECRHSTLGTYIYKARRNTPDPRQIIFNIFYRMSPRCPPRS